jgi:YgiT-type zinc finger domain-containing protein
MRTKKCPICGKLSLLKKRGDYHMPLPPNIPGETVVIPNAQWQHCASCGEDILSKKLEDAINRKCRRRKKSQVA